MNELFTELPATPPTRLMAARIALERAHARLEECEQLADEQGPEASPMRDSARTAVADAERELRQAEEAELKK